jgi:hypothetical protein
MALLKTIGSDTAFLKAGFLGFNKSGKTYTAILLAIAAKEYFGLEGQIAMFDTEGGSGYVSDIVKELTKTELTGIKSRAFSDLLKTGKECLSSNISILIVDSITHVWRELCDTYLTTINKKRQAKNPNLGPRTRLEFQDWNPIKTAWAEWADFYLTSPLHIIICGRAGYEYDFSENEDTGRKELVKTGVKMKTETEFGFEPSLLVQMLREKDFDGEKTTLVRRAVVIGDRFGVIDGNDTNFATIKGKDGKKTTTELEKELQAVRTFFMPHLERLHGVHSPVNVKAQSKLDVDDDGNSEWQREKRDRTIYCEEIQGELVRLWPGRTKEEITEKADLLERVFGTRSWTKIENTDSNVLKNGLDNIRQIIKEKAAPKSVTPQDTSANGTTIKTPADEIEKRDKLQILCLAFIDKNPDLRIADHQDITNEWAKFNASVLGGDAEDYLEFEDETMERQTFRASAYNKTNLKKLKAAIDKLPEPQAGPSEPEKQPLYTCTKCGFASDKPKSVNGEKSQCPKCGLNCP